MVFDFAALLAVPESAFLDSSAVRRSAFRRILLELAFLDSDFFAVPDFAMDFGVRRFGETKNTVKKKEATYPSAPVVVALKQRRRSEKVKRFVRK
ncbi:hypothetical protein Dimus_033442 [Dionaea muscipula]